MAPCNCRLRAKAGCHANSPASAGCPARYRACGKPLLTEQARMLHSQRFPIQEGSMKLKLTLLATAMALSLAVPALHAKTFKWASAGEISTWDIHSQNNALQNGIHAAVYESLVYYNSRTFKIEPVLATSWNQVSPTQLRLNLRQNVKFHDGSAFTADDAVYSIQRAMMKTSNFTPYTSGIDRVVKVNDNTVDIHHEGPQPGAAEPADRAAHHEQGVG
jgi:ABC-type transport system substrate-binding protein